MRTAVQRTANRPLETSTASVPAPVVLTDQVLGPRSDLSEAELWALGRPRQRCSRGKVQDAPIAVDAAAYLPQVVVVSPSSEVPTLPGNHIRRSGPAERAVSASSRWYRQHRHRPFRPRRTSSWRTRKAGAPGFRHELDGRLDPSVEQSQHREWDPHGDVDRRVGTIIIQPWLTQQPHRHPGRCKSRTTAARRRWTWR